MEHIYLVGAVACLVVSWIYILVLKAKIRDCMSYIQNRIDQTNPGLESAGRSLEVVHGSKGTGNPLRDCFTGTTFSSRERATMDEKPKLIVGNSDSRQPFHYLCSHCLKQFYLLGNQPPKEAVTELLRTFGEHVVQKHTNAAPGLTTSSEE